MGKRNICCNPSRGANPFAAGGSGNSAEGERGGGQCKSKGMAVEMGKAVHGKSGKSWESKHFLHVSQKGKGEA